MVSQTHIITIRDGSGNEAQYTGIYSADTNLQVSTIADASGSVEEDVVVTVADIVAFYIISDQAVTMKTNSSGSPDQTIALTANKPLWWNTDLGANPLTTDITKLFFDNAGEVNANIKVGFIVANVP